MHSIWNGFNNVNKKKLPSNFLLPFLLLAYKLTANPLIESSERQSIPVEGKPRRKRENNKNVHVYINFTHTKRTKIHIEYI